MLSLPRGISLSFGSLSTADLAFERKIKGHLPVTRLAVSDSGKVTVVVPDDHQPRLYHLICFSATGEWESVGSFSVEKLQHIDFSEDAKTFVAITDDDVYVFREGDKKRFFAERRDNYTALSVCASGEHFVVGSADMILSSHSVTLAKTQGGQVWVKDLPFSVTSACISDDAKRILAGSEDGMVVMLDSLRSGVWQLEGSDPITAMATSYTGDVSIIGTRKGMVYAIGDAGSMLWDVASGGRIRDCAMNRDGTLVAVAHEAAGVSAINLFCGDGTPVLEHSLPSDIASVALSPNGGYMAVSGADGLLQLVEITAASGRACISDRAQSVREEGFAAAESGDHVLAVQKLREYLTLFPSDPEACARLAESAAALVEQHLAEVDRVAAEGDTSQAVKELQSACSLLPHDREVFERTSAVREHLIADSLSRAQALAYEGKLEEAIAMAQEVISLDFMCCKAREVLRDLEAGLAAGCLADADLALGENRASDAVGILAKAMAVTPSPEIQQKLVRARAQQAFEEGLALYEAKKFSQAVFQFRKVLSLDPDNIEAQKYVEYSESLRQDDMLFDRFSKLE